MFAAPGNECLPLPLEAGNDTLSLAKSMLHAHCVGFADELP